MSVLKYNKPTVLLMIPQNLIALMRSYSLVVAYQYISSSKSLLITNVSPILIVILSGVVLKEQISKYTYFLAILTCIGCYTLMLSKSAESVEGSRPLLGYFFAFLAMAGKVFTSLGTKKLNQISNYMVYPF